jgi:hypothetical protein
MVTNEEKLLVYMKHQPYMTWYDVEEEVKSYYIHVDPDRITFTDWIEQLYKPGNYVEMDWQ